MKRIWFAFLYTWNNLGVIGVKENYIHFNSSAYVANNINDVLEEFGKRVELVRVIEGNVKEWKIKMSWKGHHVSKKNRFFHEYRHNIPLLASTGLIK